MLRRVWPLASFCRFSYNFSYCHGTNQETIQRINHKCRHSFGDFIKQEKDIQNNHLSYSPFLIIMIKDFFRQMDFRYSKSTPFSHYFILVKICNFPKPFARKVIQIIDQIELPDEEYDSVENELVEYKLERDRLIEELLSKYLIPLFNFDRQVADKVGLLFNYYNIQTNYIYTMKRSIENNIEKNYKFELYKFLRYILGFRKPENQSPLVVAVQSDIMKYLRERGEKEKIFDLFTEKYQKSQLRGLLQSSFRATMNSPLYLEMKRLQKEYQMIQPQVKTYGKRPSNVSLLSKYKFYRLNQVDFREVLSLIHEYQVQDTEQRMRRKGMLFSGVDPCQPGWKKRSYSQHPVNKLFTHLLIIGYPQILKNFKEIVQDISSVEDDEKEQARKLRLEMLIDEVENAHNYKQEYECLTNIKLIDLLNQADQIINSRNTSSISEQKKIHQPKKIIYYWYK